MRRTLITIISLAAASSAAHASGTAGDLVMQGVTVEGGTAYLNVSGHANPDGCSNPSVIALPTEPGSREMAFSAVSTALAAKLRVTVYVSRCIGSSWGTIAQATSLYLHT
ncbi:hypothetical protein [Sphingomonas sp. DT-204]|uniref:hypothetical protein n=1 Tax=Sphingomonas sp. DT-204 TaxID=3396166 RepID=UPI003F1D31DD